MATDSTTTIEDLHPDVAVLALKCMDGPTLAAASCTTSLLHSLASDPALWRRLCLSTWPSLGHPRLLDLLAGSHRSFFSDAFPFPDGGGNDGVEGGSIAPAAKLRSSVVRERVTCSTPVSCATVAGDDLVGPHGSSQKPIDPGMTSPGKLPGTTPAGATAAAGNDQAGPACLISAVDLYHRGIPVFSRVIETDTSSAWFLSSPFRVDGLERKDTEPHPSAEPAISPEDLTLSWTLIDPATNRAANVSSRTPVAVDRHWYTGETLVRFVVVLRDRAVSVVVACGEDTGHVMEVSLRVEGLDGISVTGRDGLVTLKAAMEGRRRGLKTREEFKLRYQEFLGRKKEIIERKARREGILDLCCTGFGALMFLSFLILLAVR